MQIKTTFYYHNHNTRNVYISRPNDNILKSTLAHKIIQAAAASAAATAAASIYVKIISK